MQGDKKPKEPKEPKPAAAAGALRPVPLKRCERRPPAVPRQKLPHAGRLTRNSWRAGAEPAAEPMRLYLASPKDNLQAKPLRDGCPPPPPLTQLAQRRLSSAQQRWWRAAWALSVWY